MHKVREVRALPQTYEVKLAFSNGEERVFDVTPYLDKGIFSELRDREYFGRVSVFLDSITWPNGQDLDPDHPYVEGRPVSEATVDKHVDL